LTLSAHHPKNTLLVTLLFFALSLSAVAYFSPVAHAADCEGIQTSIINCSDTGDTTESPVVAVLVVAIQILTAAIGVVAIGMLIYAGILYSSASGNASQTAKAKEIIRDTLIGLAVFAGMAIILNYLIPGGLFSGSAKFGAGGNGMGSVLADDVDLGDPSNPSSDPSNITSTSPYSLTLASWNTYVNNTVDKGTAVKSIMGSVDVVGLQEVHSLEGRKSIKAIDSSSIGTYFASPITGGGSSQLSYPIVYNKNKLTVVSGNYKMTGTTTGLSERYVIYVRFRIKATGQEFYFMNTHLPPGVEAGGKPRSGSKMASSYKTQMGVLVSTIKQVEANGLPTFLVGDFNVNFRNEGCATSWFPCQALRKVDMKSAFEYTKAADIPKSLGTQGSKGRLIDYVFVHTDSRVKVNATAVYGSASCTARKDDPDCYKGSDHRPSTARITITSKETVGASGSSQTGNSNGSSATTLQGIRNFRDLTLLNSGLIKSGVIYRSEKLENATSDDRSQLSSLLKGGAIIDLRTKSGDVSAVYFG
jgi:endonuclease/exonuclease/phosphatase family metal-dependent hydrolase